MFAERIRRSHQTSSGESCTLRIRLAEKVQKNEIKMAYEDDRV